MIISFQYFQVNYHAECLIIMEIGFMTYIWRFSSQFDNQISWNIDL